LQETILTQPYGGVAAKDEVICSQQVFISTRTIWTL